MTYRLDFGSLPAASGYRAWAPEAGAASPLRLESAGPVRPFTGPAETPFSDGLAAQGPFLIHLPLAEGVYRVRVRLGHPTLPSDTAIKAEARRLVEPSVRLEAGDFRTIEFAVHLRTPQLATGGEVKLRPGERERFTWDDRLTLEFVGDHPCVRTLEVWPAEDVMTVHLAGDSTVVDQPDEPWAGWGQMLPALFSPDTAVANHAESGRAVSSFRADGRLEKLLESLRPGDAVLMQFGHNDMKERGEGIGPYGNFTDGLGQMIDTIRARGAQPILVTPMHRRRFHADGSVQATHEQYPQAMRDLAKAQGVPLIDLQDMSRTFYEALGPEGSKQAFVHYPANTFPGQTDPLKDDSHHNNYGAYVLARCVAEGLRASELPLADRLRDDLPALDPARPPSAEELSLPASVSPSELQRPEGN